MEQPQHFKKEFKVEKANINELKSILYYHNIKFNLNSNKKQLLDIYMKTIQPNLTQLKKEFKNIVPNKKNVFKINNKENLKFLFEDSNKKLDLKVTFKINTRSSILFPPFS